MNEENFKCPTCGNPCEEKDIKSWENKSTEAGTGYTIIHFKCSQCGFEKDYASWYPSLDDDDFGLALTILAKEMKKK